MNNKIKILVVDDDEMSRDLIKEFLKPMDCEIIFAVNGVEGLSKAQQELPDLISRV